MLDFYYSRDDVGTSLFVPIWTPEIGIIKVTS